MTAHRNSSIVRFRDDEGNERDTLKKSLNLHTGVILSEIIKIFEIIIIV